MTTAFHADGSLDLEGTQKVARHLVANGHDGLVISGTTGEAPTTTLEEDGEILRAVRDAVGPEIKLVAGIGTNDTRTSQQLATQAREAGADAGLLVTPYYSKPGQRGILNHFRQVIDTAELPIMIYDIPGRTGSPITLESWSQIATWDEVVAIKDAVGDFVRGARIIDLGVALYSGDDALNLGWLAYGASGFVSVCGHVCGNELRAMYDAYPTDPGKAREIFTQLLPAFDAIMGAANYGATTAKAALELIGVLDNRHVRSPLVPLEADEVTALRAGLVASGII